MIISCSNLFHFDITRSNKIAVQIPAPAYNSYHPSCSSIKFPRRPKSKPSRIWSREGLCWAIPARAGVVRIMTEERYTRPLMVEVAPYDATNVAGTKGIVAYLSAAEQRHIPRPSEQNISQIAIHCVLSSIPPISTRLSAVSWPI